MPQRPRQHRPTRPPQRRPDDGRANSAERGYGWRWRKARLSYLRAHPLCVLCRRRGEVTPASVVDHVTPHKGDQALFWNESNWQALCKPCHDAKTGAGA